MNIHQTLSNKPLTMPTNTSSQDIHSLITRVQQHLTPSLTSPPTHLAMPNETIPLALQLMSLSFLGPSDTEVHQLNHIRINDSPQILIPTIHTIALGHHMITRSKNDIFK